jgi:hypothetical protein
MSKYYTAKRTKGLFDLGSGKPFKLSRSKIDLFIECPRCFYLDRRVGIGRPPGFPFTLNAAVDALLKKEFDIHRKKQDTHPLMKKFGIDAVPFQHEKIDEWRENFVGVSYVHPETNFHVFGAVDDLWINSEGQIYVVDYKSTSKAGQVNLDSDWQDGYKRQMEVYQWLMRQNDFEVSNVGYFVYANAKKDVEKFDNRLDFDVDIIGYEGNANWIDDVLKKAKDCLVDDRLPKEGTDCDYCPYRDSAGKSIKEIYETNKQKKEEKLF